MAKSLQAGKLIVGAIAIGIDPTGTSAAILGIDTALQIKDWFKPKSDIAKLAKELQTAFDSDLKDTKFNKPENARILLPQMLEKAFPTGSTIAAYGLDADEILASLQANLTDPEHTRPEIITAFQTLLRPLLVVACDDRRLIDVLQPALIRAQAATARDQTQKLDDQGASIQAILEAVNAGQTGVPTQDLIKLAKKFGAENLTDHGPLMQFLTEKARDYSALKTEVDTINEDMKRLANLKASAQDAIDRVDLDEVENILSMVQETELEEAAKTAELRANNALLRGNLKQAYLLFKAAADSFSAIDPTAPAKRKHDYMQVLCYHGLRYGSTGIQDAILLIQDALITLSQIETPAAWAMCKNAEAIALQNQGIRTSGQDGADLLAQAVTAYRNALKVSTRADHPLEWATTQNNLASALQEQGIRTSGQDGADLLAQAVTAYRNAQQVYTRADHPVQWAMTQNNLGAALRNQGIRTSGQDGADLLAQAVTAYRAALEVRTRADHPVQWAMTQNNLGAALRNQGTRTSGQDGANLLAQAVTAYRNALEVRTRADHPVDWAMTQENIAITFKAKAAHDTAASPRDDLQAALTAVDAALTVYDPVHMSFYHAKATKLRNDIRAALAALD